MTRMRLFAITMFCVLSLNAGSALAQITANEAAGALDSLQNEYVIGVADDSVAAFFTRLADGFDTLESRIVSAELERSLMDIFNRSRYQRAWCYFRVGEASGRTRSFDSARQLFEILRQQAEDVEVITYSTYMVGESWFWQGLMSKWSVMSQPPFSETEFQDAFRHLDKSALWYQTVADDDQAPDGLLFAANLRLGDISYERAKIFQAFDDTVQTLESFDACLYQTRDILIDASAGDRGRFKDYSHAMRCLWRVFNNADSVHCVQSPGTGAYDIACDGSFRQANISHYHALADASLWPVTDSLYGLVGDAGGVSEAYYWQGLVRSLRGEADADSLFELFLDGEYHEADLRIRALRNDAQRRIDLENETITAGNAANFLRAGDDPYLFDQAIANAKYLIRRAASRITIYGKNPYLKKAKAFLDFAATLVEKTSFPNSQPKRHEVKFYRQIVRFMSIPNYTNQLKRAQEFDAVAQNLTSIGYDFKLEADYIRAISLYEAWDRYQVFGNDQDKEHAVSSLNQARTVFETLVRDHQSVRALYRLAEIYRIKDKDSVAAVTCYNTVIEKTKDCAVLSFFKSNCEAAIALLPGDGDSNGQLAPLSYTLVQCPDYLVPGETVYWEGLSEHQGAMAVFVAESRQLLMQFALPKQNLYPTEIGYPRSVLLDDCFADASGREPFTAEVKDVLRLNPVWDLDVLVLREDGTQAVEDTRIRVIIINQSNDRLPLNRSRFIKKDIPLSEDIRVIFVLDDSIGYYPETIDYVSRDLRGWRLLDTVVLAARTGSYGSLVGGDADGIKHVYRQVDDNVIVRREDYFPSGNPTEDFLRDARLRDMVAINNGDGSTILCVHTDSGVFSYTDGSDHRQPLGQTQSSLSSAEGIAVDGKGFIYVADYGQDRVAVFDPDGSEVRTIGTTGYNTTEGLLVWGHLALPTRVMIEIDQQGLAYNGETVHRADHILVADHYGLYRFDMLGYYLDSPLEVSNEWPSAGDLYGFDLIGYGLNSLLIVANRHEALLKTFAPSNKRH